MDVCDFHVGGNIYEFAMLWSPLNICGALGCSLTVVSSCIFNSASSCSVAKFVGRASVSITNLCTCV